MSEDKPKLTIAEVLEQFAPVALAVPGVSGVYEGLDDTGGSCIRVIIAEKNKEIAAQIPQQVGGYPVALVVAGPIGPC